MKIGDEISIVIDCYTSSESRVNSSSRYDVDTRVRVINVDDQTVCVFRPLSREQLLDGPSTRSSSFRAFVDFKDAYRWVETSRPNTEQNRFPINGIVIEWRHGISTFY